MMMVEGIQDRDFLLIMGVTLVLALTVLVSNMLTDVAYAYADPRIRYN